MGRKAETEIRDSRPRSSVTTAKAKFILNSTKTNDDLISLKEQVGDLVAVVKSNQNQINYQGNKRRNLQANKSAGAQIDLGLQSMEPSKSAGPQTSDTSASRGNQSCTMLVI